MFTSLPPVPYRAEIAESFQSDMLAIVGAIIALIVLGAIATRLIRAVSVMRNGQTPFNSRDEWQAYFGRHDQ